MYLLSGWRQTADKSQQPQERNNQCAVQQPAAPSEPDHHARLKVDMLASTIVAISELALLGMEANRVIALRMQVLMLGGVSAMTEAELMIQEKHHAFLKAMADLSGGATQAMVRSDIRSVVRANLERLSSRP